VSHRLEGISAKLDRTSEQLEGLEAKWQTFLTDEQPHAFGIHHDPKAGLYYVKFEIDKSTPLYFSVLVGEIVHNLRSALDHLANEIVERHTRKSSSKAAFPIYSDEAAWRRDVEDPRNALGKKRRGPLHGIPAGSDAWTYIEDAQPYKCGERAEFHPLAELSDLSNRDKHRVIHATYLYPARGSLFDLVRWNMTAHFISGKILCEPGQRIENDTEIAWLKFDMSGPDPDVGVKRHVLFDISFGDPRGEADRGHSLSELRDEVVRIVAECRRWTGNA
jgi:hypothetical protein